MRYWYHSEERNSVGKIAEARLRELIHSGTLDPDVLVWEMGMDDWRPAREILDLRTDLPTPPLGRTGADEQIHKPAVGDGEKTNAGVKAPDPIPEACETCAHFTRVSVVNPAKGHCGLYEVERYADSECYARELASVAEEKTPVPSGGSRSFEEAGSGQVPARPRQTLEAGEWLYLEDGAPRGPLRRETIQEMLETGVLSSDALLWSDGLSTWAPVHQLDAFKSSASSRVETADEAPSPKGREYGERPAHQAADDDAAAPQKRPWVRYFARTIDGLLAGFSIGIIAAWVYPPFLELGDALMGLLVLFLFVFIEPFLLANWGTTPGKSLFRTSVLDEDGGFLSYTRALQRSFGVWLKGMGAGIPLVSLVTLMLAYHHLKEGGTMSWDEQAGSVVVHRDIGASRIVVAVAFMLTMFGLMVYGQQL